MKKCIKIFLIIAIILFTIGITTSKGAITESELKLQGAESDLINGTKNSISIERDNLYRNEWNIFCRERNAILGDGAIYTIDKNDGKKRMLHI